jgi:hypothetical protein
MTCRKGTIGTAIALGLAVALAAPPTTAAQGRGRGGGAQQYTPAPDARDLRSVLFNWGWHLGMLRSSEERDLIASLEYQGTGTMQVNGQPCQLTKYRVSTNYQYSGQRTQIECRLPNGQTHSTIEVLSGAYAWNEDIPGAELIPGKGKATPMAAATEERMIRLWAGPQGAWKAAMAGTHTRTHRTLTGQAGHPGAGRCLHGRSRRRSSWAGGQAGGDVPDPGRPWTQRRRRRSMRQIHGRDGSWCENGADTYRVHSTATTATGTIRSTRPRRSFAGRMTETAKRDSRSRHHDHGDGNGADVCRNARAGQRRGGDHADACSRPTGRLHSALTRAADAADCRARTSRRARRADGKPGADRKSGSDRAAVTTPMPNGQPDMTGNWSSANPGPTGIRHPADVVRRSAPSATTETTSTVDYAWISPLAVRAWAAQLYKPEHWDKDPGAGHVDEQVRSRQSDVSSRSALPRQGTPAADRPHRE